MSRSRITRLSRGIALVALMALAVEAVAESDVAHHDPALLTAIIADVETGWETADGTPFRQHYLDFSGARYVESGGQNLGLDDLIVHHVEPEGDALESLDLEFTDIETHFEGDFAWAVADVRVRAKIRSDGREIDKTGFETFLFRFVDGRWRVVHTHSSTRDRRG